MSIQITLKDMEGVALSALKERSGAALSALKERSGTVLAALALIVTTEGLLRAEHRDLRGQE